MCQLVLKDTGLALEDQDKADLKIKAKQFVKIYGQMASIMPYEIVVWEKLFWFLKFLIPELDPQNPNPRGAHGGDEDHDPLDDIVRRFNERWFQGWSATPEEQRIKFIHIADSIRAHPDFDQKYKNNQDTHNRVLAFQKIFEDVMLKKRRNELELYKLLASDAAFKSAMQQSLQQIVDR
jgi:type I restriction enzyme, R subunit